MYILHSVTAQSTIGIVPRDAPDSIANSHRLGAQLVGQALVCSKLQTSWQTSDPRSPVYFRPYESRDTELTSLTVNLLQLSLSYSHT